MPIRKVKPCCNVGHPLRAGAWGAANTCQKGSAATPGARFVLTAPSLTACAGALHHAVAVALPGNECVLALADALTLAGGLADALTLANGLANALALADGPGPPPPTPHRQYSSTSVQQRQQNSSRELIWWI